MCVFCAFLLHAEDLAAAVVQVADHVAHVGLGRDDFDFDDRLEQITGLACSAALWNAMEPAIWNAMSLESTRVVAAEEAFRLEIHDGIAGEDAALRALPGSPLSTDGMNLFGITPPAIASVNL